MEKKVPASNYSWQTSHRVQEITSCICLYLEVLHKDREDQGFIYILTFRQRENKTIAHGPYAAHKWFDSSNLRLLLKKACVYTYISIYMTV